MSTVQSSVSRLAALAAFLIAVSSPADPAKKTIPAEAREKMVEAMPEKAPAEAKKKRKVLVYSDCGAFYHGSIPYANVCFEIMGEKTGAFDAVVSNDLSNFEPEKLSEFDAVIFNNNTGELFKPKMPRRPQPPKRERFKSDEKFQAAEAKFKRDLEKYETELAAAKAVPDVSGSARKSLMEWVKGGKAVVGVHAATDCSYKWKDYGEMMGGYFSGHPWTAGDTVSIKNDAPDNPINAVFGGKGFDIKDEIYQFNKGVYSRDKQRVLLSLDMGKTKKKGSAKRADDDYAVSWVKPWGEGRVFYCSLGHNPEVFWNPDVLAHYLAGIQWALGDLENVETAPNPLPK